MGRRDLKTGLQALQGLACFRCYRIASMWYYSVRRKPIFTTFIKRLGVAIFLSGIFFSLFYISVLHAAKDPEKKKLPPDLRIVVDISGSMKQNDPLNLRVPALELLVKLLPEGSRAGVWTFGKYVNELVQHGDVDDRWRKYALQQAKEINSVGLYTNIPASLEKAGFDLNIDETQYQRFVILLTDGMVDVDKNPELNDIARQNIIKKIIPQFADADITIHTLALSQNADRQLLRKLAVATDGHAEVAETAEDLMKVFVNVFDQSAPTEQLPLEGNRFAVDSSVEEFTVLLFKKTDSGATVLIEPGEKQYRYPASDPYIKWHQDKRYDLITIQRPVEGEWELKAEIDEANRVTIVSDLNMVVKRLPNNIYEGEIHELHVAFQEDGKNITRKEFLELLTLEAICKEIASGEQFDIPITNIPVPLNGVFKIPFIQLVNPGKYDLVITAETKTFAREFKQSVSYRSLFNAQVEKQEGIDGDEQYHVNISTDSLNVDNESVSVIAKVKIAGGRSSIRTASPVENNLWRVILTDVSEETEYIIGIKIDGNTNNGDDFNVSLPDIRLRTSTTGVGLDAAETIGNSESLDEEVIDDEQLKDEVMAEQELQDEIPLEQEIKDEEPEEGNELDKKVKEEEETGAADESGEEAEIADGEDEESAGTGMIVGIVAVNLVLLGLFYLAYVRFLKKKNVDIFSDISDDIMQEAVSEAEMNKDELKEEQNEAPTDNDDKTVVVAPETEGTDTVEEEKNVDVLEDFPELTDSNDFSIDDSDFDGNMDFGEEEGDK